MKDSGMYTAEVLDDVEDECTRQIAMFGDPPFSDDMALAVLIEEVGEVGHAINEDMPKGDLEVELLQVAAVAVSWVRKLRQKRDQKLALKQLTEETEKLGLYDYEKKEND